MLPRAARPVQERLYLPQSLSGDPALKKDNGVIGHQPLRAGMPGRLRGQLIGVQAKQIPGVPVLNNGCDGAFLVLLVLFQLQIQFL